MAPRFPNNTERLLEIGRTGTGKTVAGLYNLAVRDLTKPWIIFNFKNDEHIESLPNTRVIDWNYVPQKRDEGVFIIHVMPADTKGSTKGKSNLETYVEKLWYRQNVGQFYDEVFMVGQNDAVDMSLTQGRSRRMPMIGCTQKPSWISTFWYSEASFFQVFDLNDDKDIRRVEEFLPLDWYEEPPLKKHESYYYDVAEDELFRFAPCPNMDEIRNLFESKLKHQRVRV